MEKKLFIASFLSLVLSFLILHFASASVLREVNKKELIDGSDSIVVGEVLGQTSGWDQNGRFIVTYVKVKVEEDLTGAEGGSKEIVIKKIGGTVGDIGMMVNGDAQFRDGERALLFLNKRGGYRTLHGLAVGKFMIVRDRLTGDEYAVNGADPELKMLSGNFSGKITGGVSGEAKRVQLKDLIADIKRELKGGKAKVK